MAGALVIVASAAPNVVGAVGTKRALVGSLVLLAGGLVWLAMSPSDAGFVMNILGPSILIGVGLGGVFVLGTQLSVDGVDEGHAGLAGGLVNTSQQIGGALGLAVLASIATARTAALEEINVPTADALTSGFSSEPRVSPSSPRSLPGPARRTPAPPPTSTPLEMSARP